MKETPGRIEFVTLLVASPGGATVTLPVPREVSNALGTRARVDLKGTVNGKGLRAPAMPDGKGGHTIQLSRELQDLYGAAAGARVKVVLERIEQEPPVEAPADLAKALAHHLPAKAGWEKMPPPSRRAWVDYVGQPKKPEERARRITEALARIALGKTP
jgi:hypothetical protein